MISVICPIFDFDNLLKENIISVLNQEFNNFELILINFHSNKKLNNILECFKQKDKRIKVICPLVNQDSSDFVNECIKNAKGKYIYFWDYHFYLSKNAFKSLFESAEKDYLDYLVFNYSVDVDGILFLQYDISNDYFLDINNPKKEKTLLNKVIITPSLIASLKLAKLNKDIGKTIPSGLPSINKTILLFNKACSNK